MHTSAHHHRPREDTHIPPHSSSSPPLTTPANTRPPPQARPFLGVAIGTYFLDKILRAAWTLVPSKTLVMMNRGDKTTHVRETPLPVACPSATRIHSHEHIQAHAHIQACVHSRVLMYVIPCLPLHATHTRIHTLLFLKTMHTTSPTHCSHTALFLKCAHHRCGSPRTRSTALWGGTRWGSTCLSTSPRSP
jgi:hypothetical protein